MNFSDLCLACGLQLRSSNADRSQCSRVVEAVGLEYAAEALPECVSLAIPCAVSSHFTGNTKREAVNDANVSVK